MSEDEFDAAFAAVAHLRGGGRIRVTFTLDLEGAVEMTRGLDAGLDGILAGILLAGTDAKIAHLKGAKL